MSVSPWLFLSHCCHALEVALFLFLIQLNMQSYIFMRERQVISVARALTAALLVVAEVVAGTIVTSDSRGEGCWIMSWPRCFTLGCPAEENDSNRCQPLTAFRQDQGFCWSCSSESITELSHCHTSFHCWPLVCVFLCVCQQVCVHDLCGSQPANWVPLKETVLCVLSLGVEAKDHN